MGQPHPWCNAVCGQEEKPRWWLPAYREGQAIGRGPFPVSAALVLSQHLPKNDSPSQSYGSPGSSARSRGPLGLPSLPVFARLGDSVGFSWQLTGRPRLQPGSCREQMETGWRGWVVGGTAGAGIRRASRWSQPEGGMENIWSICSSTPSKVQKDQRCG